MCRGVYKEKGLPSGLRQISYSSPRFPSPVKIAGNCGSIFPLKEQGSYSRAASPRAQIAGRPIGWSSILQPHTLSAQRSGYRGQLSHRNIPVLSGVGRKVQTKSFQPLRVL